jgi:hypothetical protein
MLWKVMKYRKIRHWPRSYATDTAIFLYLLQRVGICRITDPVICQGNKKKNRTCRC